VLKGTFGREKGGVSVYAKRRQSKFQGSDYDEGLKMGVWQGKRFIGKK